MRRCFCVARFALPLNSTHTHTHHPPQRQKLGEHEVIEAFDAALLGDSGGVPPMREGGRRRIVVPPGIVRGQRVGCVLLVRRCISF